MMSARLCGQSVLSTGTWHKLSIKKSGVYKVSYDLLKKMGFTPSAIDPRKIRIHGNPGGMLPQPNNESRPQDLTELAIMVQGETDGKFDKNDFILFYADGPDRVSFDAPTGAFTYEHNLYSDENFYFITVGTSNGKRVTTASSQSGGAIVTEYNDFFYHELEEKNELNSGRDWFGEKVDGSNDFVLSIPHDNIVPGSQIRVASDVMGQSYLNASFKVFLNDNLIGQHAVTPISPGTYSTKGEKTKGVFTPTESSVGASQNLSQELRYKFMEAEGYSQGFIDRVLFSSVRKLRLADDQLIFQSAKSLQSAISTYEIESGTSDIAIWDVTPGDDAVAQTISINNGVAQFTAASSSLKKYIIFKNAAPAPDLAGPVPTQNLHGFSTPNLVIVSHPLFLAEAERLAAHRRITSGWTVQVVTTDQVYNEFSSGRQDITAIRDFVKYLYDQSPATLRALLLIGRGSYDYKDRVNDNTNFVPVYESRNSLNPLQTYASDDYYGFLENTEGFWSESPVVNHTMDIGVGRLPVTTVKQAESIVNKIIQYESMKWEHSPWRKKIVFVADDGNSEDDFSSLHQEQSDALASWVESTIEGIDIKRLFMGTYKKVITPNSESVPDMEDDLVRAFRDGTLIINFTGHGAEKLWTDERILSEATIGALDNDIYPFLVTATCEFGRNDDSFQTSSAEFSVTKENGGAIGIVTTTRPVIAFPNFSLNQAFYEALFNATDGVFPPLGQVFRETKNGSFSGVSNRNFMLLADPSLTLAIPSNKIVVTSAKTIFGSDTLKALSTVEVDGEVRDVNDNLISTFDGIAEIVIYDKRTDFKTIGRNDPAFEFSQWHNVLFRGKATVDDGVFHLKFIMPKNISYTIGEARMSVYGSSNEIDHAKGSMETIKIGGTETQFDSDITPPSLQAFMGDTTFINGGITSPDTKLIVKLSDTSGINISDYGLGNSLVAVLDDDAQTFVLNSYYVADVDDYGSGTVIYPLQNLEKGRHTFTIKGWDVHNNPARTTVDFIVTDGSELRIGEFGNFPNPVTDKTTFFLTHNRSGDDLEAQVFIFTLTGDLLFQQKIELLHSEYMTEMMILDNSDKKLPAGLYVARVVVRSLTNGSKNEQVTKLIILN